jgi:hypothetical protein
MRLELAATTTYPSGVVLLRYRTTRSAAPAVP